MSERAGVLGALLDGHRLAEASGSVFESMVSSQAHVGAQVAATDKSLAGMPHYDPKKHPRGAKGSGQGGKFIKKGSSGTPVKEVQKALGVAQTGAFAFDTQAAVQNFQREHGLQVDGVVGAQTAQALLGNRNAKAVTPGALSAADAKALGVPAAKKHSSRSKSSKTSKRAAQKATAPTRIGGGFAV